MKSSHSNFFDYVYDLKIKFELFYLLVKPNEAFVKLPSIFNEQHIQQIATKVWLCDPAGNMFLIAVEKHCHEAYFMRGWTDVGKFYGLDFGGWVKLVFVGCDLFFIQLRDRLDTSVVYPLPPKVTYLGQTPFTEEYPMQCLNPSHYAILCKKPDLYHCLDKTLTYTDLTSGFLHIPLEFCQLAFRHSGIKIFIFDEYGNNSRCTVEFDMHSSNLCGLTEGWHSFCLTKSYVEGIGIQVRTPPS